MEHEDLRAILQQIKAIVDQALDDLGHGRKPRKMAVLGKTHQTAIRAAKPARAAVTIDFDKPIRPFIKQYSKDMSGPERFTLLLARLVEGDLKKEVQLKEVEKQWNAMTSLMDRMEFNRFFPSQAKDRDWVESKKRGFYNLRPNWKEIFK